MQYKHHWTLTALSLITILGLLSEGTATAVSFKGIGNLGKLPKDRFDISPLWHEGLTYSYVAAISADGSTVVGQALTTVGDEVFEQPLLWTRSGGLRGFGGLTALPTTAPSTYGDVVSDVSGDGSVIVGISRNRAWMWNRAGESFELASLGGGMGWASAVSANGQVVVGMSVTGQSEWHAFRWEAGTEMVDLWDFPTVFARSWASGLSADGSVVVGNLLIAGGPSSWQPFRWDKHTGLVPLDLPRGYWLGSAHGVSADGRVVVGYCYGSGKEAFAWSAEAGTQRLGDLPGGPTASSARAASADGKVIVGYGTSASSREAVLWDRDAGLLVVRELLTASGIDLTGWVLDEAIDVSADGMVVVGNGINPEGNREGWIASFRDEPPVVVNASGSTDLLWPPNQRMTTVRLSAQVEDDSGTADWGVVGIECNEASAENDMQIVDHQTVHLRATRSGSGANRIYTIYLQAADAAGNLSELFPVQVTVPHDLRTGTAPGDQAPANRRR